MKSHRQKVGAWGETLAAEKMRSEGYEILAHNYHTPYGEIDLIAFKEDQLVFVEVKTRTNENYGLPEQSVTMVKQEHLLQSIEYYLFEHPEIVSDWRVDVIAIQGKLNCTDPEIIWFENALE